MGRQAAIPEKKELSLAWVAIEDVKKKSNLSIPFRTLFLIHDSLVHGENVYSKEYCHSARASSSPQGRHLDQTTTSS